LDEAPTLKSPSVARTTVISSFDKILLSQFISQFYSCSTSCASTPALSFPTHQLWFAFSSPDVGDKLLLLQHKPQWLLCLFFGVRLPKFSVIVSVKAICWDHSSNLKHQSRKPSWKLADYPLEYFALQTNFNNWCFDSGQSLYSVVIENGFWSCGCGFFVLEKIDHFFSHGIFRHGLSVVDETSYVGIRSIVNINRKWKVVLILDFRIDFLQNFIVFL
jgi:hypothetical protein